MGSNESSLVVRYGMAVLAVAAAQLARLLLDPLVGDGLPFLLATLAVVVVAWRCGFGPSLVALLLGLVTTAYCFLPPRHDLAASLAEHPVLAGGFLFLGVTVGIFSEGLRAAQLRTEAHAREAVRRRQELEEEVVERKRLEQELRCRAEQLVEADRRKDAFLAMLGHELRNPLAPLRNAVEVMRRLGLTDPKLDWARAVIDRQVAHMTRLVDDLLDVSRVSRGRITLRMEPVALAEVVVRAVESSRPLLEARRHKLTVELPDEPVRLEADPVRLAQVVNNLLNNAAKYTAEGGRVRLTAERQVEEVVLRVGDNGVGIAPEMLSRVFDPFSQAEQTLDRSAGGLGLGLTLVKSLVEMHGGRVEAFSEGVGRGSEFVVRLPVSKWSGEPSVNGSVPAVGPSGSGRRVLVVDDNVDPAESLATVLRMGDYEVRIAYDGLAALDAADQFQPEVVLLDIGLPKVTGYEIARRLRERASLKNVFLVAVTGYGQDEDRRRAEEAGFDAHLVKPADPAALERLLALPERRASV
jgi:signal transduction histidine kinase/ActR/RegA family two-component response regulator